MLPAAVVVRVRVGAEGADEITVPTSTGADKVEFTWNEGTVIAAEEETTTTADTLAGPEIAATDVKVPIDWLTNEVPAGVAVLRVDEAFSDPTG